MKFKINDLVKCINDGILAESKIKPPLELNKEYTILDIQLDSKNNQHLHVGLKSNYNYITSLETGEELKEGKIKHWCHPSRFTLVNN